jgi:hypothetical protein
MTTALTGWLLDDDGGVLTTEDGQWLGLGNNYFPLQAAPRTASYQLDLCNNFERIGVCTAFEFAAVERRNETGEWEIVAPVNGVEFAGGSIHDVDSIIVWDTSGARAVIVAAGVTAPVGSIATGVRTVLGAQGKQWVLTGVDLFGLLATRVAYPDPGSEAPWATAYDERTGPASTVATEYITNNLGVDALSDRQVSGVTVIDTVAGDDVTWTARLQPLSTLVTQVCNAAGIVCRPRMSSPGAIEYVITSGADRTANTVISDMDLIGDVNVTAATARATHVVAGGSGTAASRTFATASDGSTGLDRLESFYDVSNLTGISAVSLAANGSLLEQQAETAVSIDTLLPRQWRYRTDFDIGDTISVEADSVRYSVLVDAVSFTITPSRSVVRPLLGRTTNNESVQIMRTLWGTAARFNTNIL